MIPNTDVNMSATETIEIFLEKLESEQVAHIAPEIQRLEAEQVTLLKEKEKLDRGIEVLYHLLDEVYVVHSILRNAMESFTKNKSAADREYLRYWGIDDIEKVFVE
jgi:hypothetical protein